MKRIIFATHNQNKMQEIREIFAGLFAELSMQSELGITLEPEENGKSFAENAEIKALAIHRFMKQQGLLRPGDVVMADDSGLCIDYLDGAPGILSARFMGENTSYEVKNAALIERLRGVSGAERSARFVCNICAVLDDGRVLHAEESFEGLIAEKAAGSEGFGYDPILYLPELGRTSAEISREEKNRISHRGKALRAMRQILGEL